MRHSKQMYNIEFYAGPRDGDEIHQSVSPITDYFVPVSMNMIDPSILGLPVTESLVHYPGVEVHHYQLEKVNRSSYVYKYRGVEVYTG